MYFSEMIWEMWPYFKILKLEVSINLSNYVVIFRVGAEMDMIFVYEVL